MPLKSKTLANKVENTELGVAIKDVDNLPLSGLSISDNLIPESIEQPTLLTPITPINQIILSSIGAEQHSKNQGDEEHYILIRSNSDISEYSDLVDFMLDEQLGLDYKDKDDEHKHYKILDVIVPSPERAESYNKIKKSESDNKSLGQKARYNVIDSQEKDR
jgi:hypothetical protein